MSAKALATALAAALIACAPARTSVARDGDVSGLALTARMFTGLPRDVVVSGDVAYVGLDTGVAAYDVADPADPILVSEIYLPSPAFDLALDGTHLVVANGESGLAILDVSDPSSPSVVGRLATEGTVGVAVSGGVAFLAEASDPAASVYGLRSVSLADPTSPVAIGFAPLANGALDLVVAGSHAFVGVGSDVENSARGLAIVDISAPAAPSQVSFFGAGQPVNEVALDGNVAYLATGFPFAGALVAVDVVDVSNPWQRSRRQLADAATGISIAGGVAQVAARSLGVLAFDVSGADPVLLDAMPTGRQTWCAFHRGDVVFVGERSSTGVAGFTTVSMMPLPQGLAELASAPYAEAQDVAAAPGLALLLRRDGLAILDNVSAAPLGAWTPPGADFSVMTASPDLAAVADGPVARLVDIVDPTAPAELGQVTVTDGVIVDMKIDGDILFVADGRGLDTFSVASPSAPSALGTYRTGEWASAIAVDGDRAALVAGSSLEILDVSSPGAPALLGSIALGDQLYGVAIAGDLVVVTGYATTLATVDVGDPANPVLRATIPGGPGFDVLLSNGRAVVASGPAGIDVFDVTDPAAPIQEGYFDTSGVALAVALDGAALQVATSEAQHWLLACATCAPPCASGGAIGPAAATICEGETLVLDGTASSIAGCAGAAFYQWFRDGFVIPGATGPTYTVPATETAGAHQYRLVLGCSTAAGCESSAISDVDVMPETYPFVDPASLRVHKVGGVGEAILSWQIQSGSGRTNVHRSLDVLEMTDAAIDEASIVHPEPTTAWVNDLNAGNPSLIFYKVLGRRDCSGLDAP